MFRGLGSGSNRHLRIVIGVSQKFLRANWTTKLARKPGVAFGGKADMVNKFVRLSVITTARIRSHESPYVPKNLRQVTIRLHPPTRIKPMK
jgi:hypothetical protein